jgi:hypothetical protein
MIVNIRITITINPHPRRHRQPLEEFRISEDRAKIRC